VDLVANQVIAIAVTRLFELSFDESFMEDLLVGIGRCWQPSEMPLLQV
jgi:hypothetical protein